MALEDKDLDANAPVDERIAAAIRARLVEGRLPCVDACEVAEQLALPPIDVGQTADRMQVRLTACQLGLFGYPGHAKGWEAAGVAEWPEPDGLRDAISAARNERGEISCGRLWQEAERFGVRRIQAGWIADQLGVTIRECHLGAF